MGLVAAREPDMTAHETSGTAFVWLDLEQAPAERLESVAHEFDLDVRHLGGAPRPTLDLLADKIVLFLRTACHVGPERVECGELTVVAGERFVVTAHRGEGVNLGDVRARIEDDADLAQAGPGPALRAIVGRVLDDWDHLVRGLYEDVDRLEELVLSPTRMYRPERIYNLMRELLRLDRAIAPLVPELEAAEDRSSALVSELAPAFREWRRRVQRLLMDVDHLREHVSMALQIHQTRSAARLAQVSVHHAELATRENEQMRKIAAWAAIVGVPTFIAGLYGMNFRHMPELGWTFGYPLALGVMVALCVALFYWFRRIDWL
jgi:magnesium transporter